MPPIEAGKRCTTDLADLSVLRTNADLAAGYLMSTGSRTVGCIDPATDDPR